MKSLLLSTFGFWLLALSCSSSPAQEPKPLDPKSDLKTLVQGNNEFAFDLYARLAPEKGNIVLSPFSLSNALGMTYAGARGETAEQMARALHFTLGQERLHPAFAELIRKTMQEGGEPRPHELYTVNALWGQSGLPLRDQFVRLVEKDYGAAVKQLDFARDPEAARLSINQWAEEQTRGKIKELLTPKDMAGQTRLVLTNAVYLKATWEEPFSKVHTKEAVFEREPGKTVKVPMMRHPNCILDYYRGDDFQLLELPYKGGRLSMVVLLPNQKGRLAEVEKSLTLKKIDAGLGKMTKHLGDAALPRFKVTAAFRFGEQLKDMGMRAAFTGEADFSGITSAEKLWISNVIHQASVDVDELGTEAAAATAVRMASSLPPPFSFRADHPFLLLIRDRTTGSILFFARVENP